MTNTIYVKTSNTSVLDTWSTQSATILNTKIVFAQDSLIYIKINDKYTLAKIVSVPNKETLVQLARLLVLDNNYPELKVYLLDVNDTVDFFYADSTLIDKDILLILDSSSLEDAEIKANTLVDKRKKDLDNLFNY